MITEHPSDILNGMVSLTALLAMILFPGTLQSQDDTNQAGAGSFRGMVQDAQGKPQKGIFVQARNLGSGIGITVLSNKQGKYHIEDLPPGKYAVLIDREIDDQVKREEVGVRIDLPSMQLKPGESRELDFTLDPKPPEWTELSNQEYRSSLPERPGKSEAVVLCANCHGFRWQSLHPRNEIAWRETIDWIATSFAYHFFLDDYKQSIEQENRVRIASFLASVFGPDADLPEHPTIERQEISDDALDIVYVDYPLPAIRSFPWMAVEDKEGMIWVPQYNTNQVARLDPVTGKFESFRVPSRSRAAIQAVVPAGDGTVWLAARGTNMLIHFDPIAGAFTHYQPNGNPLFKLNQFANTLAMDHMGRIWVAGGNLITRFDPASKTFHYYGEAPLNQDTYTVEVDHTGNGNVWYGRTNYHRFGRINLQTDETMERDSPTPKGGSRHIATDSKGNAWFGEWNSAELFRISADASTIKHFPIPGPFPKPDAIGIDKDDQVWYYSWGQSELGRIDPDTGKVVVYPVPYVDTTIRSFNRDSRGRLWFGSPPANRVGYFYLRGNL